MDELDAVLTKARAVRAMPDPTMRRHLRERCGLSQGQVAALLGVRRPTVSRWESASRNPRGPLAERYAALLSRLAAEVLQDAAR